MGTDKREIIISVGERLFSKNGYRNVSVQDITRASGLATGSFYASFSGKEDLYSTILDRLEKRGVEEAERHVAKFNSPMNKLKALYRFSLLALKGNPIIRGLVTRDRKFLYPGTESRAARSETLLSGIERLLDDILQEGRRKRVFRTGLFQNPHRMLLSVYSSVLLDPDERTVELMNDVLLLIERGIKRRLRLRQRDERLDRRMLKKP